MNKKYLILSLLSIIFTAMFTAVVFAWEGYDVLTGNQIIINIEKGSYIERGDTIEYFDVVNQERSTGIIDSIYRLDDTVNLYVIDDMDGETKHFEMFDEQ